MTPVSLSGFHGLTPLGHPVGFWRYFKIGRFKSDEVRRKCSIGKDKSNGTVSTTNLRVQRKFWLNNGRNWLIWHAKILSFAPFNKKYSLFCLKREHQHAANDIHLLFFKKFKRRKIYHKLNEYKNTRKIFIKSQRWANIDLKETFVMKRECHSSASWCSLSNKSICN